MLVFNFSPFPVLETSRFVLDRIRIEDAPDEFAMRSNERFMQFLDRDLDIVIEDSIMRIKKTDEEIDGNRAINFAIRFKGESKMIGSIGYYRNKPEHHNGEIGYGLHPDYHRQGIMSECMSAVLDYGFGVMKLHSILANTSPDNIASHRLLEKHGFVREGYFKENYFYNGKFTDSAMYGLIEKNRISP